MPPLWSSKRRLVVTDPVVFLCVSNRFAVDAPEGALETAFFLGMLFLSHRTFRGIPKGNVKARGGKKSL